MSQSFDAAEDATVAVAGYEKGEHHRLVRIDGTWRPIANRREFENAVFAAHPDLDLDDPKQVHWAADKDFWPAPKPGPHQVRNHEGHHHDEGHHPNEVKHHRHEKGDQLPGESAS